MGSSNSKVLESLEEHEKLKQKLQGAIQKAQEDHDRTIKRLEEEQLVMLANVDLEGNGGRAPGEEITAVDEIGLAISEQEDAALKLLQHSLGPLEQLLKGTTRSIAILRALALAGNKPSPPTLLHHVFHHFVKEGGSPFLLREVCTQWRQIADDHGEFWSQITVTNALPERVGSEQICTNLAQLSNALGRARDAPLDISVNFVLAITIDKRRAGARFIGNIPYGFDSAPQQMQALALLGSDGVFQRWRSFTLGKTGELNDQILSAIQFPSSTIDLLSISLLQKSTKVPGYAKKLLEHVSSVEVLDIFNYRPPQSTAFSRKIKHLHIGGQLHFLDILINPLPELRSLKISSVRLTAPHMNHYSLKIKSLELIDVSIGLLTNIYSPDLQHLTLHNIHRDSDIPVYLDFPQLVDVQQSIASPEEIRFIHFPPSVRHWSVWLTGPLSANDLLSSVFDGGPDMPRTQSLTIKSKATEDAFIETMDKWRYWTHLKTLTLNFESCIGEEFWINVGSLFEKRATCPTLENLVVSYENAPRSTELLPSESVKDLISVFSTKLDRVGHPLKNLTWIWINGSITSVRGEWVGKQEETVKYTMRLEDAITTVPSFTKAIRES